MTEREAKEKFRNQRDAVQKQKDEMASLNESLNKQIQINEIQQDSLHKQLRINSEQREELEQALAEQRKLSLSLNEQVALSNLMNDSLVNQIKLNKEQQIKLENQNKELEWRMEENERQAKIIKEMQLQSIYNACLSIRSALSNNDMNKLSVANRNFESCGYKEPFTALRLITNQETIKGHFVYSTSFIDELLEGNQGVFENADNYASPMSSRGIPPNPVFIKNDLVRTKALTVYKMACIGHEEICVITEPNGYIGVKIWDSKKKIVYYDTSQESIEYCYVTIELPSERNFLEIIISNKTNHDVSYVLISN